MISRIQDLFPILCSVLCFGFVLAQGRTNYFKSSVWRKWLWFRICEIKLYIFVGMKIVVQEA